MGYVGHCVHIIGRAIMTSCAHRNHAPTEDVVLPHLTTLWACFVMGGPNGLIQPGYAGIPYPWEGIAHMTSIVKSISNAMSLGAMTYSLCLDQDQNQKSVPNVRKNALRVIATLTKSVCPICVRTGGAAIVAHVWEKNGMDSSIAMLANGAMIIKGGAGINYRLQQCAMVTSSASRKNAQTANAQSA